VPTPHVTQEGEKRHSEFVGAAAGQRIFGAAVGADRSAGLSAAGWWLISHPKPDKSTLALWEAWTADLGPMPPASPASIVGFISTMGAHLRLMDNDDYS
jgi:hypothetical protein